MHTFCIRSLSVDAKRDVIVVYGSSSVSVAAILVKVHITKNLDSVQTSQDLPKNPIPMFSRGFATHALYVSLRSSLSD